MKNICNKSAVECMNGIDIIIGLNGYLDGDSEWKSDGMSIPYSKLYFVTEGKGYIRYGNKTVILQPRKIYLIPFGLTHSFGCDNEIKKLYFHVISTHHGGPDLFEKCNDILEADISKDELDTMKAQYFSKDRADLLELKAKIFETISKFYKLAGINDSQVYSHITKSALMFINSNLSIRLSIRDIAKEVLVSESTLSKQFSADMGISIGKYIDRTVMTKAQQLLIRKDLSVKEISEKLGFCDRFYFSRKFSKYYNITPVQYRRLYSTV